MMDAGSPVNHHHGYATTADTLSPSPSEKGESDKDDDGERRPLLDKDSGKEAESKRGERVKWRSVLVVCVLWFAQIIITSAYSLVAPFFPKEISWIPSGTITGLFRVQPVTVYNKSCTARKGANIFITGVIISASPFCLVVCTPLIGYFLPKLGMKFTLVSGMLFVAGGFFLMGFLVDMPAGVVFLVFAILLRMTEGLGWAMFTTTTFSLLAQLFPTRVGTLTGMMEVATGLGFSIGPPLGGLLYTVGGFRLPFLSVGGVLFLIIPFTILLVPTTSCSSKVLSLTTLVKLLSHLSVFMLLLGNVICFTSFTFLNSTFAPFLSDKFGFNQLKIALMFAIVPVVYFVCAMITGRLSDKFGTRQFIISGFVANGISLFFIGPAPFISTPRVWITIVALLILGFGAAQGIVPLYSDLLKQAHTLYPEEDKAVLTSVVSGMAAFSMALGEFTGPLLGGALTQITDFPTTSLLIGELAIAQAILLLGVTLIDRLCRRTMTLRIQ